MDNLAAVFRSGASEATLETISKTELRQDEVLVKLVATGICHTDLTCCDGFMALPRPIILGHEGAGRIQEVGTKVNSLKVGDPVVLSFLSCGHCDNCEKGCPAYCHLFVPANFSGRRLDGSTSSTTAKGEVSSHFFGQSSFATHSVAQERSVVKVRGDAPLELLGPLGCGFQTGAGALFNVLSPSPGESIAIFGAGGVGLAALLSAKIMGCDPIIVVEPNAERRTLAIELGASYAVDPLAESNLVEELQKLARGQLNNAFDTSGIPQMVEAAIAALFVRGKIALVTSNKMDAMLTLPLISLVGRGVSIRGVNMGDSEPKTFIPKLVDLIMQGRFPIDRLVKFYEFGDINQALEDQRHGRVIKPILRMNG